MDSAGEKEAPGSGFDTTLEQSPDLAPATQAAIPGEQRVLLAKHAGGADLDHGRS